MSVEGVDPVESTVIACVIHDRSAREYAAARIDRSAFTSMLAGEVFASVMASHADGRPVVLPALSGEAFAAVTYEQPGMSDMEAVDLLRERVARRRLVAAARAFVNDAEDESKPLERLRGWSPDLPVVHLPDPLPALDDLIALHHDRPYRWLHGPGRLLPGGLGLLERRDRLVLVASSGAGKSTWLRQVAYQGAAGVHWSRPERRIDPFATLIIDAENSEMQTARAAARLSRAAHAAAPGVYEPGRVKLLGELDMDLNSPVWRDRVEGHLEVERPDLLIIGPIYKLFSPRPGLTYEENANYAREVIDGWRLRYDVAVILEAHSTKGADDSSPDIRGSQVWVNWPEFAHGLAFDKEVRAYRTSRIRHDRDVRDWPTWWFHNARQVDGWPWVPCHDRRPPAGEENRYVSVPDEEQETQSLLGVGVPEGADPEEPF